MKKIAVFLTSRGARFAASLAVAARLNNGFAPRKIAGILAFFLLLLACSMAWGQGSPVVTYHSDGARSGEMTDETILIPSNVNSTRFGKLYSYPVDGFVVAQPLYVPNVTIPGQGTHNVVYVVTQHDSVYAFDADNFGAGTPLWHVSFINPGAGITTVPISEQLCSGTGFTEMGIMGTPAIDLETGTLYLSAKTREQSGSTVNYVHRIHAMDITTGADKITPVVVDASVVNSVGNTVWFHTNNLPQCQRPGLLLSNGTLFVAYGSNGCDLHSFGWVMAYDPSTLEQLAVFNTAPTPAPNLQTGASLWMSGGGIGVDEDGSLYISTANGPFDAVSNWGDSVLKLGFNNKNNSIRVTDYFTPFDQANMATTDLDLGSGGVTILPDQPGLNPHLLVTSGKTGTIYLVNRDGMGHYNPANQPPKNDNNNIVQALPGALGLFNSVPVYWSGNNRVYFAARNGDAVKAYQLVNGMFSPPNPVAQSLKYSQVGVPAISSAGATGGILWNIHNPTTPLLSALDATTLAELYNSGQKGTRDTLGPVARFISPTIANNKVFMGTTNSLSVYGVFPYLALLGGNAQSAAAATILAAPLTVQAVDSQGNGVPGVSVIFSDNNAHGTFNPATAITDSTGTATTRYTVPTKAGTIAITASLAGFRNVLLSATAIPGPAAVMARVSGVNQYGTVGTTLASPLVVNLRDAYGNGVVGQQVTFTDGGAGGALSPTTVTTGAAGAASVTYRLPTKAQYIVITATSGSVSSGSAEHAVAGPASSASVWSGNNQSVKVSTQLAKPLVVLVTDQYGNKIPGITVTYSDGGAGGTFSNTTPTTNNGGQTSVTYTAPATAQVVQISATVSGLSPAMFTETVHN